MRATAAAATQSDPDGADSQYRWNAFGELEQSQDANGRVAQFAYDALGRQITRTDVDLFGAGAHGVSHWYFDGEDPDNPSLEPGEYVGAITMSVSPNGNRKRYSYNETGQLTQIARGAATGPTLAVQFGDYQQGRPQLITYPTVTGNGTFAVRRSYDAYGHLTQVARDGQPNAAPFWALQSTNYYDEVSRENFGNGTNTQYQYDNLGRVNDILDTASDASAMRDLGLRYDLNGNVHSRIEIVQMETLEYDGLDRLTASVFTSLSVPDVRQPIAYDSLGNITSRTGVGGYQYQAANPTAVQSLNPLKPHAVSQAGSLHYEYDNAGNVTRRLNDATGDSDRFSWTPFGKIAQIWRNASNPGPNTAAVTLAYDADGERIIKQTDQETTSYLEGLYERRVNTNGTTQHVFYVDNGARVVSQVTLSADAVSTSSDIVHVGFRSEV